MHAKYFSDFQQTAYKIAREDKVAAMTEAELEELRSRTIQMKEELELIGVISEWRCDGTKSLVGALWVRQSATSSSPIASQIKNSKNALMWVSTRSEARGSQCTSRAAFTWQ